MKEAVILFSVGDVRLAIAATAVEEIRNTAGLRALSPTRAPLGKVRHILDHDARRYPVVDASFHFHLLPVPATRLLVLRRPAVAVLVQRIDRMAEITAIHALPRAFTGDERRWYRGLALMSGAQGEPEIVPVVSPEAFLSEADARLLPPLPEAKEARA